MQEVKKFFTNNMFHFDNRFWHDPKLYDSIVIYQIGDLSCDNGYAINESAKNCYEIVYVASGKGCFFNNNIKYPVSEGDIFLSLPGQTYSGKADSIDPYRLFYLGFGFVCCEKDQNSLQYAKNMFHKVTNLVAKDIAGIQVPFINMFNEMLHGKDYSDLIINSCIHQIIVYAYRSFFNCLGNGLLTGKEVNDAQSIVYKLINYIDTHLFRIKDLSEIAERLGYSYSYISHVFSKETGLTILGYYNRKRFEKAVEWLESGEFSITEISEKLGYQSIHTFGKAFKKVTGISPAKYKASYNTDK